MALKAPSVFPDEPERGDVLACIAAINVLAFKNNILKIKRLLRR